MDDFFKIRGEGVVGGIKKIGNALFQFGKEILGHGKNEAYHTGILGVVRNTCYAILKGLFDKDIGLLNFSKYQLPLEHEDCSVNLMEKTRQAIGLVVNSTTTLASGLIGVVSPTTGKLVGKVTQGAATALVSPIVGNIRKCLIAPTEELAANDSIYDKVETTSNETVTVPVVAPVEVPVAKVEVVKTEEPQNETPKDNVVSLDEKRKNRKKQEPAPLPPDKRAEANPTPASQDPLMQEGIKKVA